MRASHINRVRILNSPRALLIRNRHQRPVKTTGVAITALDIYLHPESHAEIDRCLGSPAPCVMRHGHVAFAFRCVRVCEKEEHERPERNVLYEYTKNNPPSTEKVTNAHSSAWAI